jgi:nicotinate-nucleotide adenylyltransferase
VLAQEAAAQLGLEEVVLVPSGRAPHKRIEPEPGPEVRLRMAQLAAAGNELLRVSGFEVESAGTSYSVRTLEALSEQRPEAELHFLMGADVAAQMESWHRPERVLELARIGIAAREGTATDEAEATLARLGARVELVRMPRLAISSSELRRRIREQRPIRYLVPDPVVELIAERGLYREPVTA